MLINKFANALEIVIGKLHIIFRKLWQKTEAGKPPVHFHWCNCGLKKVE